MLESLYNLFVLHDYTGGMFTHFGIDEDSPIIHAFFTLIGR